MCDDVAYNEFALLVSDLLSVALLINPARAVVQDDFRSPLKEDTHDIIGHLNNSAGSLPAGVEGDSLQNLTLLLSYDLTNGNTSID